MIISAFFYLIAFFITLLSSVFSFISFAIPDEFIQSISYFLGHFNYLRGFLDVDTFFSALGTVLTFLALLQIVKLGLWVWGHMPWVGKHAPLPSISRDIVDYADSKGGRSAKWIERSRFK